jgi:hypothetical protein
MHLVQQCTTCVFPPRRRFSVGRTTIYASQSTHKHFYAVEHCPHIVLTASDEFQPLAHLLTREIGSLLFVPPWYTLLAEWPCLHENRSKKNEAIKIKLRSRDHSSTNSKHAYAEGSVTNLKMCYGESADNFLLSLAH